MKLLTELDSLDNVKDGETRKLITKATSSGSGNVVSSVSVSGDTITYTKGVTALTAHQNAFSKVKVGTTDVAADSAGDTLELVAGSNITLTPDATNDKVTIAASQPTVNNGTLTIQKNGTNVQTFTANQSENATANIIVPTKTSDLTNDSNFITGMFIASYGSSTYAEVLDAYQKNKVIYCRASSNANPATGNQLRMAFLAYVNNQTTPTEFEFQYYRSVNTHSASQQGDQVYVYKLNSSGTWSVTTREAYTKMVAGTGLSSSYSSGTLTLSSDVKDVKINNTSILSSGTANIATEGTYNASSNKIATMSDVSSATSGFITTTHSEQSEYDGSMNWGAYGLNTSVVDTNEINGCSISAQPTSLWLSVDDNDNQKSAYIQLQQSDNTQTITLKGDTVQLYPNYTPSSNDSLVNKKYVDDAITALPEPMIFKGSLGTGGTITSLPTAAATNEGYTYKVITAGTYASQSAKIGDLFICAKTGTNTYAWTWIPSGDEPSGTVTSVTLKATSPIAIDSESAITTSGTRTLSHATSGVTAGTYRSVTVNDTGHVTAGTNPTTLSGYGITDAKITGSTITLGSKTITPSTATNWVNGSAVGSVRTTSATTESSTYTMGDYAVAEGSSTSAIARASHAEGESNTVTISGLSGHAEGCLNTVSGNSGHAEGYNTVAEGNYSHSQNRFTQALGISSHAEGEGTMAFAQAEHVSGTYNVLEIGQSADEKSYAVVVGNGTNSGARSNAHTLDWSGNAWFSGDVYVGSTGGKNKDSGSKKLLTADDVTDTKNTAGSTDTSSKIFLIGATSQAAHPQTYSDNEIYATSGVLTTKSVQVGGTAATMQYNSTDKCIEFIFA